MQILLLFCFDIVLKNKSTLFDFLVVSQMRKARLAMDFNLFENGVELEI